MIDYGTEYCRMHDLATNKKRHSFLFPQCKVCTSMKLTSHNALLLMFLVDLSKTIELLINFKSNG